MNAPNTPVDREYPSIAAKFADQFAVEVDDGVTIAAYELTNAQSDTPVLLWGHANGFSAGSYLPLLRRLVDGGYRVFAYDVRGQGGSTTPPEPFAKTIAFDRFARDLQQVSIAVLARSPGAPIYFAGHSFSAAAMYYLGGGLGFAPWRAVTTFDATLRPSNHEDVMTTYYANRPSMSHGAMRRRRFFDSGNAYLEAMGRPRAFGSFAREMLEAHCHATLRPRQDGAEGWELSCPPEVEAATYEAVGRTTAPYDSLPGFPAPAHMIGADPEVPGGNWIGQLQPEFARRLPHGRYTKMLGHGHLMPFERPAECAGIVLEMLRGD